MRRRADRLDSRRWRRLTCFLVTALAMVSALGSSASAGTVANERPLLFSFRGSDASIGSFTAPLAIASNETTGDVYVINAAGSGKGPTGYGPDPGEVDDERVVCRFDAEGESKSFTAGSASGRSCLDGKDVPAGAFGVEGFFSTGAFRADVAIDNSAANPGRIYLSEEAGPIYAFGPDGAFLWRLPSQSQGACGIAVDREGHLWVGNGEASGEAGEKMLEYASSGSPPALIKTVAPTHGSKLPCRISIDSSGEDDYVGLTQGSGLDRYRASVYDSTLSTQSPFDVTVDQSKSAGHIFAVDEHRFSEYEPCIPLHCQPSEVPGSPFGGDFIGQARGIAYNPSRDWVYVTDKSSNSVKVFGPVTSGTVPDVTCAGVDEIARTSATAHCTINPQSVSNTYHFEYERCAAVECTGAADANWASAESTPTDSIEPTDSADHPLSAQLSNLAQNSWYAVRLVGTNAEPGENLLSAYSNPSIFKTLSPPPAQVEGCSLSAIGPQTAHVACSVDSKEDETTWRVLEKAQTAGTLAECEAFANSEFDKVDEGTIPAAPDAVEIQADLEGLLPAQHYCVRVVVANGGGGNEEDMSFHTIAIAPSEVSTAFAAPRTDTTARINGRVSPNGEADLEYRFEVSENGVDWTQRPILTSSIDAREQIVVADEISGLQPDTTYHYRLGFVRNSGGTAVVTDDARTFTARSEAEMADVDPPDCANQDLRATQHATYLGACRGVELVNNPDKGNQNVLSEAPAVGPSSMSADGERVLWRVGGGAPGGPNGALSTFVAERGEAGWTSRSAAPPADQQFGGGGLTYELNAVTPDFASFVFGVRGSTGLDNPPAPTVARLHAGVQDVLKSYVGQAPNPGWEQTLDLSDNADHVLFIDAQTKQLEDIGNARLGPPPTPGEMVSLMPGGSPSACGLDAFGGTSFGTPAQPGYHWIGTIDASRVYFRVPADHHCAGPVGLYVRNRAAGKTTLIDAENPTFLRATPDGRRAYFATSSSLDPSDTTGGDVYRWDESTGKSTCLTCVVAGGADLEGGTGGFAGILVSDDSSHVYFISQRKLVPGVGKEGSFNLYALSGGEIRFVTVVAENVLSKTNRPALSSNGNVLLFRGSSRPSMTADAMAGQCARPNQTLDACEELYRYDDDDQSLECLSCDHDGLTADSLGTPYVGMGFDFRLSGDGRTTAFATSEALLPSDVNGDTDIYETRYGVLHLLTDGVSSFQEGFSAPRVIAIDQSGSNILFALVPPGGSLTGFESDQVANLYDARIDGGFEPPAVTEKCHEDSCQGPLRSPPSPEPLASSAFRGSGNQETGHKPRCSKGKVRRRGRCIKRHRKPRHQAHPKETHDQRSAK
jgi:hypothetical protein